ncbi:MAG: tyrosine-type recombinase/integrase [Bacilli bacterium]|uniref:tyrosine-type recombinase/integrase n=1 Tax=Anaerorhabdus sp. TaxID=1872524 RepID=UPI002FCA4D69
MLNKISYKKNNLKKKVEYYKIKNDGYANSIFINHYGNVQNQGMLNKALCHIMRDCNDMILYNAKANEEPVLLPRFSYHSLSHTFTTHLCESGINIKAIQDVSGHADTTTTMNIYTDATKELKNI